MGVRLWILIAALLGATGVGLGAYHAHGLEKMLQKQSIDEDSVAKRMDSCETAVHYQLIHAVAILAISGVMRNRSMAWHTVPTLWFLGVIGFSWVLSAYALAGAKQFHFVVPIGGLLMILGWIVLGGIACSPWGKEKDH